MDEMMDDMGHLAHETAPAAAQRDDESEAAGGSRFDPTLLNQVFGSRIPAKLATGRRIYGVISDTPRRLRMPLSAIR